jgi:excisionase family DNA binding protein
MSATEPQVTDRKADAPKRREKPHEKPRAYTVRAACEILSISRSHLYALEARRKVKLIRLGGRVLVRASEIDRILQGEAA